MNIKRILLKLKYGYKSDSESYYKYLKKKGIILGNNVKFYSPWSINVDIQRPWMIEIGNDVHITAGCSILQHGYDWAVLQKKYGEVLGSSGKVKIGNNVFIGQKTTILKGVTIGDDIIIGAKSLVNKNCTEPGVYAGNPVKYIMSLDDYYNKRKNKQIEEAVELVKEYYNVYKKYPEKEYLREYFWLFEDRNAKLCETFEDVLKLEENYEYSKNIFLKSKSIYNGYSDFIDKIKREEV